MAEGSVQRYLDTLGNTSLLVQLEHRDRLDVPLCCVDGPAGDTGSELGIAIGSPERCVKADLARLKELIETRGDENGGWR